MLVHLCEGDTSVVVDVSAGAPVVVHWGARLPDDVDLDATGQALGRAVARGALDAEAPVAVVPEHGAGWPGRPGLTGSRSEGTAWSPRFRAGGHRVDGATLRVTGVDDVAGLSLQTEMSLGPVLSVRCHLTNTGTTPYRLDALTVTLPLPDHATELLSFHGRWCRELHPARRPWTVGAELAENRRGRTSHDHVPLVYVGEAGFGEWRGEVWGFHLAWSGNHSVLAEVLADGRRSVQLGELLHPGEVVLAPGATYSTPEVLAVHSPAGLTPASWGFHRHVRSYAVHPTRPRPVLVNTWEAVYFDHDHARLRALADTAAALGMERFVLDDGWFGGRRDDTSGLGDWWVSPEVYPDGLGPLISYVRSLGLEFGVWVEPEMVNPDSELYRAHPDWALTTDGYEPVLARQQLVLDLGHPEAYRYVFDALDALLRDHDISYLKWDMNRDHVQGSGSDGRAGTHRQTLAVYRLLDELRARHPGVEIESCSSGGARIDLEILRRTERVWTSDCNDALERQLIQRGASMLIPPELMGAHIGPTRSHTTGRRHSLGFRAASALFGHLGVEWDLTRLDDRERDELAAVIAVHRRFRPLLHSGDAVRFDHPDQAALAHGVYAADRSEALVAYVQLSTASWLVPPVLRLPGLDPHRPYRVEVVPLPGGIPGPARTQPTWLAEGITLTGAQLATHGVRPPVLWPEHAVLFRLS